MTVEHIKEDLSTRCIEALANRMGYSTESTRRDYGIDLRVVEVIKRKEPNGKTSYVSSNREIKAQLKATTDKQIRRNNGTIKYDLRVKNYNDIVYHINNQRPTYLFLIIMPDDETKWIEYDSQELIFRSKCYWYIHPEGTEESKNAETHVIEIPETQTINFATFAEILDNIYS
jgi:Domain of unknown function (DUF4365)